MKLHSLYLENVRQFSQSEFHFNPGVNLIIGENGAGKTTILRAIETLINKRNRQSNISHSDIRFNRNSLSIKLQASTPEEHVLESRLIIQEFDHSIDERRNLKANIIKYSPTTVMSAGKTAKNSSLRSRRLQGHEKTFLSEDSLYRMFRQNADTVQSPNAKRFGSSQEIHDIIIKSLSKFLPDIETFTWIFEPYRCELIDISEMQSSAINTEERPGGRKLALGNIKHHIESRIIELIKKQSIAGKSQPWGDASPIEMEVHNPRLPSIFSIINEYKYSPYDFNKEEFIHNKKVKIHTTPRIYIKRKHSPAFTIDLLSDGERRLFSLFVNIARELSLQNSHLPITERTAVVLIDEIETHLHPKWQRLALPALEDLFPNCQFIATTHSPFVIQGIKAYQLQPLTSDVTGNPENKGIEEIALKIMGIENPEVSPKYIEMLNNARKYFTLLETNPNSREELHKLKKNPQANLKKICRQSRLSSIP